MNDKVIVDSLPKCDFCDDKAVVDGKTQMGPWACMCELDFNNYGVGLGLGKGQRLIPADDPPVQCSRTNKRGQCELAAGHEGPHYTTP